MKKIVVLGPESTGKSELCRNLAAHFKSSWVKEYAREYLETTNGNYSFADIERIAMGQLHSEDLAEQISKDKQNTLFIDTDLYVVKIWSEFIFNRCENSILKGIASRRYDLYLLCNIDLPWMPDEFREQPDIRQRQKIFCMYKDALINQHVPWVEISGHGKSRTTMAIQAVESILQNMEANVGG